MEIILIIGTVKEERIMPKLLTEGIEESELRYMHNVMQMSQRAIANYYGVGQGTVQKRMQECCVKPRTKSDALVGNERGRKSRRYSINEDFFKEWSFWSAWVYGWFLGDGSIASKNTLKFAVAHKDREVLYKIRKALGSEHPIIDISNWDKRYQKYYYASKVCFCSKDIVTDLKKLSYTGMPEACLPSFIRGFFEAEGSVGCYVNNRYLNGLLIKMHFYQSSKSILKFIFEQLKQHNAVTGGSLSKSRANDWQLTFNLYDSISLYHYIYDNCSGMFLTRKKNKLEEAIRKVA